MGFAEVGDNEAVFTDGDIEALRTWDALVASGTIAIEDEVPHARVMGQTLSRLAEWQAREVMARADMLAAGAGRLAAGGAAREAGAADMAGLLLPVIERLQSYVWRRHLAAAYERILLQPPGEPSAATTTVGFADMVGYTRTARHSPIEDLAAGEGLPALRVGMAAGRVLSRFGDVYGPVVNLAARLTSLARPGTALVDAELAAALRADGHYRLQARRPAAVRGYHHLRSWALRPR